MVDNIHDPAKKRNRLRSKSKNPHFYDAGILAAELTGESPLGTIAYPTESGVICVQRAGTYKATLGRSYDLLWSAGVASKLERLSEGERLLEATKWDSHAKLICGANGDAKGFLST